MSRGKRIVLWTLVPAIGFTAFLLVMQNLSALRQLSQPKPTKEQFIATFNAHVSEIEDMRLALCHVWGGREGGVLSTRRTSDGLADQDKARYLALLHKIGAESAVVSGGCDDVYVRMWDGVRFDPYALNMDYMKSVYQKVAHELTSEEEAHPVLRWPGFLRAAEAGFSYGWPASNAHLCDARLEETPLNDGWRLSETSFTCMMTKAAIIDLPRQSQGMTE